MTEWGYVFIAPDASFGSSSRLVISAWIDVATSLEDALNEANDALDGAHVNTIEVDIRGGFTGDDLARIICHTCNTAVDRTDTAYRDLGYDDDTEGMLAWMASKEGCSCDDTDADEDFHPALPQVLEPGDPQEPASRGDAPGRRRPADRRGPPGDHGRPSGDRRPADVLLPILPLRERGPDHVRHGGMMKTVHINEIIDWLKRLPPETIVYEAGNQNHCTLGTYAMQVHGVADPRPAWTFVSTNTYDMAVKIDGDCTTFVARWDDADEASGGRGLTAAEALSAVADLLPRTSLSVEE